MNDTTERADALMRALMASRTPAERVAMACRMFDGARTLVRAGILAEHGPEAEANMREHFLVRFYGGELDEAKIQRILASWVRGEDMVP